MDNIKLVEKIKKEKKFLKMTNAELAEKSGVALGTLNKILSFKTSSIKMETLNKILIALSGGNKSSEEVGDNSFGFVKVASCSPEVRVADVSFNLLKIKECIEDSESKGAKLIVFPELSLSGATCGDLFFQDVLLIACQKAILDLVAFSKSKEALIIVGAPIRNLGNIYDVAVVICKGEILGFVPKKYLLNEQKRYFKESNIIEIIFNNKIYPFTNKIVFTDSVSNNFSVAVEFGDELFQPIKPSTTHAVNGANIIACLSASNELVGRNEFRRNLLISHTEINKIGYVYANAGFGESSTDLVFSGHSLIVEKGEILQESTLFKNESIYSDIDVEFLALEKAKKGEIILGVTEVYKRVEFSVKLDGFVLTRKFDKMPFVPKNDKCRFELILQMQASALQKRIRHVNPKTLVIGVSGGLDSTLALLVAVRAMKNENRDLKDILAITMPCFGTTKRTKNNAIVLAEALGVSLKEVNIKFAVLQHFNDIGHDERVTDVTYENSQARERTQVLMDIANKTGGIVLGTGDLSEMALGWATYNGDHMSMYSVNSSVPKTLIRYLVAYEAERSGKVIKETLLDILDTPVSPELLPPKEEDISQKTEDIVGPYLLHDFYLYYALRCSFNPRKIFFIAKNTFKYDFSDETLYKWLKNFYNRFFNQQFKRSCVPDGVKIGSVGLSPRGDLIMPSDACKREWLAQIESIKI